MEKTVTTKVKEGGFISFLSSRQAIPLQILLLVLWLSALAFGGMAQGKIGTVTKDDAAAFLPQTAESTLAAAAAKEYDPNQVVPLLIVGHADGYALRDLQIRELQEFAATLPEVTLPDRRELSEVMAAEQVFAIPSEDRQAALIPLSLDADAVAQLDDNGKKTLNQVVASVREAADSFLGMDNPLRIYVSGPAGLAADLGGAFAGIDLTLLLVALILVFIILIVVYRSIYLPIAVLVTAMAALCGAVWVVFNLAKADIVSLDSQSQGILAILVIGATTDYCLLLIARFKEEISVANHPIKAMAAALKGSWEPIVASGGTVAAGLLTLTLSDLKTTSSLGPIAALGIAFSVAAALSLLPGILLLVGKRTPMLFWPAKLPHYENHTQAMEQSHGAWHKVATFVSRHDRSVWMVTLAVLGICAVFFFQFQAKGTSATEQFTQPADSVTGFDLLENHFASASSQPTTLIIKQSVADTVKADLEELEGVDSVSYVLDEVAQDTAVVGMPAGIPAEMQAAMAMPRDATFPAGMPAEVGATMPPSAGSPAGQSTTVPAAEPKTAADALVKHGRVMLNINTVVAPQDKASLPVIEKIRGLAHAADPDSLVGGAAAQTLDTQNTATNDFKKVFPAVLIVIVLLLIVLLRSLVAPLLVLAVNVVSFGAAMGLSGILFFKVFGHPGADASVPIYSFVFLVALGVDYTIFLLSRAREEAMKYGAREGIARAAALTGGVITSAGVVLAATFAALSVVPLLFMFQLAVIVALGILIDTFLVRSLVIVGLVHDIGRPVWWPWTTRRIVQD